MQEVDKKNSRKAISANPERQVFKIFTLVPTMVAFQGDAKLNRPMACPKYSWIWQVIMEETKLNCILLKTR